MLVPQLVSASQDGERQPRDQDEKGRDEGQAPKGVHVRDAEEAVGEAVDYVEERIEVRKPLPESGQRMDRVEHPGKKRERHDEEILEGGDLVDFLGPDAGYHPERAQNGASSEGESDNPQGMAKFH